MIDQINQYLQLLQYGAFCLAFIACILLMVVLTKLNTIEKGQRFNSHLLLSISQTLHIPQQPPPSP
jgi:hypothetical protein